jgi:hypothetical protein
MLGDLRTVKEIEREMCIGYDVEYYDKASLKEMERMISSNAYTNFRTLKEHMDFLERLLFKLQTIKMEEIREGFPTLELDEAIAEINMLFRKLSNVAYLLKE